MFDDWQSIVALVVAILIAYAVILWLGIVVWAYRDIRERTRDGASQTMAVLLVVLFNMPGLFLYLLLRPHETLPEAYERRLQNEALMRDLAEQRRSCPSCQHPVKEDFLFCPHCRAKLQEPCARCRRALEPSWIACPNCGAQAPQPAAAPPVAVEPPAAITAQPPASPESGQPAPQTATAAEGPAPPMTGRSSRRQA